jgi:RimJ/RimL family protein N-acetyltransferase
MKSCPNARTDRRAGLPPVTERLHTGRLILRRWEDTDRETYAELASDAVVMQYLEPLGRQETSDAWIDRQNARFAAQNFGYWAVELQETGQLVGAVGLSRVRYEAHFTPAVGVGWRLARPYWGHGYASEAAVAALKFGFEEQRLKEIVAITIPANIKSQQVMRRLGMTYASSDDFDHPRLPEGHPMRRCVLYRLSRSDWSRQSRRDNLSWCLPSALKGLGE